MVFFWFRREALLSHGIRPLAPKTMRGISTCFDVFCLCVCGGHCASGGRGGVISFVASSGTSGCWLYARLSSHSAMHAIVGSLAESEAWISVGCSMGVDGGVAKRFFASASRSYLWLRKLLGGSHDSRGFILAQQACEVGSVLRVVRREVERVRFGIWQGSVKQLFFSHSVFDNGVRRKEM